MGFSIKSSSKVCEATGLLSYQHQLLTSVTGASYIDTPEEVASGNPVSPSKHSERGVVDPGDTFTYTWTVPERAGPLPNGPSSMVWLYHSHANEVGFLFII